MRKKENWCFGIPDPEPCCFLCSDSELILLSLSFFQIHNQSCIRVISAIRKFRAPDGKELINRYIRLFGGSYDKSDKPRDQTTTQIRAVGYYQGWNALFVTGEDGKNDTQRFSYQHRNRKKPYGINPLSGHSGPAGKERVFLYMHEKPGM